MRAWPAFALAVVVGCSLNWDKLDPDLGVAGSGGQQQGGEGGVGGSGGEPCVEGTARCDDTCIDVLADAANCGDCGTTCASGTCEEGLCRMTSCADHLAADPAAEDGVFAIHPMDVAAPFPVHCDMTTEGGGWTLVASVVDNAHFANTRCQTFCEPDPATTCDETPFTTSDEAGDVADYLTSDHKSLAYSTVPFTEMLFADSGGLYATYAIAGDNVTAWFPAGLENHVLSNIEEHPSFSFPVAATNVDLTDTDCASLQLSFNVEDSDGGQGSNCSTNNRGPVWPNMKNNSCFWDDGGTPWAVSAFYFHETAHRLWLVR